MTRRQYLIVAIFCVAVVAVAAGGAAAVDDPENATDELEEDDPTYLIEIDDDVRVVSADMSDDRTIVVTLEADESRQVAITDASQEIDGAVDINYKQQSIPEGETEIEMRVANPSQPAITIATTESMVGIGDQEFDADRPAVAWQTVQGLLLVTAVAAVGITTRVVAKKREDEQKEVERIL